MRAACRPRVECSTSGPSVAPATEPAVSSVFAHRTVGSCPCAKPTSTCASGPTCIGLPSNLGDFTHEYLPASWKAVLGIGRLVPRMFCPVAVARVRDALGHVLAEVGLVELPDRAQRREVAVHDRATRQVEAGALGVERHVRNREVVRHALPVTEPVGIHARDGADVREATPAR